MDETTAKANEAGTCTDFCSLPPEQVQERASHIRAELVPQTVARREVPGGFRWEFPNRPETEKLLGEFVEFERRCCAGMTFVVEPNESGDRLCLTVTGEGAEVMATLGNTGAGASTAPTAGRRALQAGGLGLGVSVFVCCLLPLGLTAVAGAAVAAPLATLDQPLYIVLGGLLAGGAAWAYLARRDRTACETC